MPKSQPAKVEEHFRGGGYNDATEDQRNRGRRRCDVACRALVGPRFPASATADPNRAPAGTDSVPRTR
jgi:hypothetical protein